MFPRIKFHRQTRWIGVPSNLLVPLVKSAFTLGLPPPPPRHPPNSAGRLINISRDTLAPGFLTPWTTSARASRSIPDDTVFIERCLPRVWGNHDPRIATPCYRTATHLRRYWPNPGVSRKIHPTKLVLLHFELRHPGKLSNKYIHWYMKVRK